MKKKIKRSAEKANRVEKTAELTGKSKRTVQSVIGGQQMNDNVLNIYMKLSEGENLLIQAVKKAVPFSKKIVKYERK